MRPTNAYAIGVMAVVDQLLTMMPVHVQQEMLQQLISALQERVEEVKLERENGFGK